MLDLNTMARLAMQEREREIAMARREAAARAASPQRPHRVTVLVATIARVLTRRQRQTPAAPADRAPVAQ